MARQDVATDSVARQDVGADGESAVKDADRIGSDGLVLGTHGREFAERLITGSAALAVTRRGGGSVTVGR